MRAVDGGEPPLYSEAEVSIRVRDENDNTPTFIQPPDIIRLRSADPPILTFPDLLADISQNIPAFSSFSRPVDKYSALLDLKFLYVQITFF